MGERAYPVAARVDEPDDRIEGLVRQAAAYWRGMHTLDMPTVDFRGYLVSAYEAGLAQPTAEQSDALRDALIRAQDAETRAAAAETRVQQLLRANAEVAQTWVVFVDTGIGRITLERDRQVQEEETRSWGTAYRGLVAIHAAKGWTLDDRIFASDRGYATATMPRGCIVAVATLADVVPSRRAVHLFQDTMPAADVDRELGLGDYRDGRYAWELRDVIRLEQPIAATGALGLWPVTADVEIAVRLAAGMAGR